MEINKKQAIDDFMSMRLNAELKALKRTSLERPFNNTEHERFKALVLMKLEGRI